MNPRLLLMVVLGVSASGCASRAPRNAPEPPPPPLRVTEVPMRLVNHVPLVQVRVGDKGPFWFLFDTGSDGTMISESLATQLGLTTREARTLQAGADKAEWKTMKCCTLDTLRLGDAKAKGVSADVLDLTETQAALGKDVQGLLGLSFFAGCLVTLDYPAGKLILEKGKLPPPDGKDILSYERVIPIVSLSLGAVPVRVEVDSGFGGCLSVPESVWSSLKFLPGAMEVSCPSINTVAQHQLRRAETVMTIGRHRIEHPMVIQGISPWERGLGGWMLEHLTSLTSTRIGGQVLEHFTVTFDPAQHRVRFSRAADTPIQIP